MSTNEPPAGRNSGDADRWASDASGDGPEAWRGDPDPADRGTTGDEHVYGQAVPTPGTIGPEEPIRTEEPVTPTTPPIWAPQSEPPGPIPRATSEPTAAGTDQPAPGTPSGATAWTPGAAGSLGGPPTGYPIPPSPPPYQPPPVPGPPGPRRRPAAVTIAVVLLLLLALLGLAQAVLGLANMTATIDRFRDLTEAQGISESDIDASVSQMRVSYVFAALLSVLIALALAGLAFGLLRGSNGARVTTWLVSGVAVVCDCCSSAFYFTAPGINLTIDNDANTLETQLAQAQLDAFPSWFLATNGGISLLELLGYIAVAVLLALPAANLFFRKPAPGWQPPAT